MKSKKLRVTAVVEIIFDILYLCVGLIIGGYLLATGDGPQRSLYGIMALVLILGDSFHLIPRIRAALSQDQKRFTGQLGAGKMITSITMTVFYVILWHVGLLHYAEAAMAASLSSWTVAVYAAAVVRIALCLFPQNEWLLGEADQSVHAAKWNIFRNIPFVLLGGMVLLLFFISANIGRGANAGGDCFRYMWAAIFLSFAFYIPVVLGSRRYPMLGMLMLPKTCAYVWILCMGLGL